jgi:hypothetical protein
MPSTQKYDTLMYKITISSIRNGKYLLCNESTELNSSFDIILIYIINNLCGFHSNPFNRSLLPLV